MFSIASDNIWRLVGSSQVMFQILLWVFAIYVTDFVLIPDFFKENKYKQFALYFSYILHQLCMIRNLYMAMYTIPKVKEIPKEEIKKNPNEYSICKKCSVLRPLRSHHCSICEMCVDKMDHHCYVLNNCVGKANYRFFFSYIFLTLSNAIMILILSFICLLRFRDEMREKMHHQKFKLLGIQIIAHLPLRAAILFLISVVTVLMMSYFVIYHLYLIYRDETTIERKYPKLKCKEQNKKKFTEKISEMLQSENWLDVYWPD